MKKMTPEYLKEQASAPTSSVRGILSRASIRATLPYLGFGLLILIAIWVAGHELKDHLNQCEAWINSLGPWGILAFVVIFVVATSCFLPDTVLCIIAGALFGIGWGVAAAVIGYVMAASVQYALSRKLLKHRIEQTLSSRPSLDAIQRAVRTDELRIQVLLRLTPLNPATISYLMGAAGVRFRRFLLAALASTPCLFVEVYFGHAGKHAALLSTGGHSPHVIHNVMMFAGLLVCLIVMVAVSKMARNALSAAVDENNLTRKASTQEAS
jgi:uncharacterized membrane protein YdjX (TVP38/TMEM64 family)